MEVGRGGTRSGLTVALEGTSGRGGRTMDNLESRRLSVAVGGCRGGLISRRSLRGAARRALLAPAEDKSARRCGLALLVA